MQCIAHEVHGLKAVFTLVCVFARAGITWPFSPPLTGHGEFLILPPLISVASSSSILRGPELLVPFAERRHKVLPSVTSAHSVPANGPQLLHSLDCHRHHHPPLLCLWSIAAPKMRYIDFFFFFFSVNMLPPRCAASLCQPQRLYRSVFMRQRRKSGTISAVISADTSAPQQRRLTAVLIVVQLELPSARMGGTLACCLSLLASGIFNPKGPFENAGMSFAPLMESLQCHKCNQRALVLSRSALCFWTEGRNVLKEQRRRPFWANSFHSSLPRLVSEFASWSSELRSVIVSWCFEPLFSLQSL